ncbi:ATP-binding cassette domain-containing protein [Haloarchaeobius iranensis]|uniref:Cobalamin import ATP-binding protein BtuD n=1 Tax=Haloarchaeobius iranensis TaxID=996166 RepID=A0A1G9TQG7_9EURY|nr:ATP-binding cassette domain-containing protein [Haloarchaeobius iranensis]SDM50016.1 iron complex transport system ATP-binding protein [Haloarchaeobius iranensis]
MIDVDGVSVSFGDATVLDDVSLSVERGTFLGLVGPNGAGKTTFLRAVSGALPPDAGTIALDGDLLDELGSKAASRRVAVVPQDTAVSFGFTARDVVAMGRTPHRGRFEPSSREDSRAVDEAFARVDAEHLAARRIDELSGGERQTVTIARALAQETPILLLDEPTASLDINHQVETLELVADLVADGKTVVAAIHDLSLAARYCDELALLADGDIVATGLPESVLTRDRLADSFDARTVLRRDPVTESLGVTTLARQPDAVERSVHLVGSGSVAARTLERLVGADTTVTVGPVAPGDALAETASLLGVETIERYPHEPLDDPTLTAAREAIDGAAVVAVANPGLVAGDDRLYELLAGRSPLVVVEETGDRQPAPERAESRAESLRLRGEATDVRGVVDAVGRARPLVEADD